MTIQLIDSTGKVLLSASPAHEARNAAQVMPTVFEGDKSLLIQPPHPADSARTLITLFYEASQRNGLKMGGDYESCRFRDDLIL